MSTEIVQHTASSALEIAPGQDRWNDRQVAALRQIGVENATEGDLAVFLHQCQRTGLDPFARQVYMIGRNQKVWDPQTRQESWVTKFTIQTGIDGFRLIASRTGKLDGYEDTLWCGDDGRWSDVWLSDKPPAAAKVTVIRNGARFSAVALYREYAGTDKKGNYTRMWSEKPAVMIAKCAEALALRKAFPQDLSGLYTSDEMAQADRQPVSEHRQDVAPENPTADTERAAPSLAAPSKISANTDVKIQESESPEWLEKCREWLQGYKESEPWRVAELEALIDARVYNLAAEADVEPEQESADEQLPLDAEVVA